MAKMSSCPTTTLRCIWGLAKYTNAKLLPSLCSRESIRFTKKGSANLWTSKFLCWRQMTSAWPAAFSEISRNEGGGLLMCYHSTVALSNQPTTISLSRRWSTVTSLSPLSPKTRMQSTWLCKTWKSNFRTKTKTKGLQRLKCLPALISTRCLSSWWTSIRTMAFFKMWLLMRVPISRIKRFQRTCTRSARCLRNAASTQVIMAHCSSTSRICSRAA